MFEMGRERLPLLCAKEYWVTRSEHRPGGWLAIVILGKFPQESPREKVVERTNSWLIKFPCWTQGRLIEIRSAFNSHISRGGKKKKGKEMFLKDADSFVGTSGSSMWEPNHLGAEKPLRVIWSRLPLCVFLNGLSWIAFDLCSWEEWFQGPFFEGEITFNSSTWI